MRKRLTLCPTGITPGDITARCGGVRWRRITRFLLADFRHNCELSRTDVSNKVVQILPLGCEIWNCARARSVIDRHVRSATWVGGRRVRLIRESFSRRLNKIEHPSARILRCQVATETSKKGFLLCM